MIKRILRYLFPQKERLDPVLSSIFLLNNGLVKTKMCFEKTECFYGSEVVEFIKEHYRRARNDR